MTNLIKTGCKLLLIMIVAVGLLSVAGGVALGLIASYRLDLIQAVLPKEQVRVLETVKVQLNGPRYAIQGDRAYFHSSVTGAANRITWSIHPYKAGMLNVSLDRRTCEFSSLDQGHYTITVAAAGEGNQPPAIDQIEFENVALASEEDLHPEPVPAAPVTAMGGQPVASAPPEPPPASTAELTAGALAMVTSANKAAEARLVADVIYSLAKQIRGGLVPQYFDIPLEIERRSNAALRERAGDWGTFMVAIDTILTEKIRQGVITSETASQWPVLLEIANGLTGAR